MRLAHFPEWLLAALEREIDGTVVRRTPRQRSGGALFMVLPHYGGMDSRRFGTLLKSSFRRSMSVRQILDADAVDIAWKVVQPRAVNASGRLCGWWRAERGV